MHKEVKCPVLRGLITAINTHVREDWNVGNFDKKIDITGEDYDAVMDAPEPSNATIDLRAFYCCAHAYILSLGVLSHYIDIHDPTIPRPKPTWESANEIGRFLSDKIRYLGVHDSESILAGRPPLIYTRKLADNVLEDTINMYGAVSALNSCTKEAIGDLYGRILWKALISYAWHSHIINLLNISEDNWIDPWKTARI